MMLLGNRNPLLFIRRFIKQSNCYKRLTHYESAKLDKSDLWIQPDGYNTGIRIYNPIIRDKVDLVLKKENLATWYCCGPTVYDSAHIGHASCYVKFDVIRRILEKWFNINVIMVMGITDIDDKIIKKANEMKTDFRTISTKYEVEFFNDMSNLNLLSPTLSARVTDYIPNIVKFINEIIVQGYAYVVPSGSVYFKTTAFKRYNKFGLANLDEEYVIEFQDVDECKQSPLDFVLWKAAKPGEPYWSSPWGRGRPGWHIECSVIASAVFGSNIDLHSGGIDLKFPHHENEEAQSCSHYCVDQWVNYWMYSGHLHFKGGEKMSKSLKNTLSIDGLLQKYSADEFRILCLMSPYRNAVEYSDAVMTTASGVYRKIEAFIHTCEAYIKGQLIRGSINEELLLKEILKVEDAVRLSLRDDFNTPLALSCLLDLISTTNGMINEKCENVVQSPFAVAAVLNFIKDTFIKFGLCFDSVHKETNYGTSLMLSNVLDAAVDFRCNVRQIVQASGKSTTEDMKTLKKELFNSSDDFRQKLNNIGVELQGGPRSRTQDGTEGARARPEPESSVTKVI